MEKGIVVDRFTRGLIGTTILNEDRLDISREGQELANKDKEGERLSNTYYYKDAEINERLTYLLKHESALLGYIIQNTIQNEIDLGEKVQDFDERIFMRAMGIAKMKFLMNTSILKAEKGREIFNIIVKISKTADEEDERSIREGKEYYRCFFNDRPRVSYGATDYVTLGVMMRRYKQYDIHSEETQRVIKERLERYQQTQKTARIWLDQDVKTLSSFKEHINEFMEIVKYYMIYTNKAPEQSNRILNTLANRFTSFLTTIKTYNIRTS